MHSLEILVTPVGGRGCIFVFVKDLRGVKGFYTKLFLGTPDWTTIYSEI